MNDQKRIIRVTYPDGYSKTKVSKLSIIDLEAWETKKPEHQRLTFEYES